MLSHPNVFEQQCLPWISYQDHVTTEEVRQRADVVTELHFRFAGHDLRQPPHGLPKMLSCHSVNTIYKVKGEGANLINLAINIHRRPEGGQSVVR